MSNPSCRGFHELWQLHSARVCLLTSSMAHNCTSSRYCVGLPHLCIQCIIGPTSDVGIRPIWTVLSSHCHFVICIVYFAIRLGIKCCTSSTFSAEYVSLCILTANLNRTLAKVKKKQSHSLQPSISMSESSSTMCASDFVSQHRLIVATSRVPSNCDWSKFWFVKHIQHSGSDPGLL